MRHILWRRFMLSTTTDIWGLLKMVVWFIKYKFFVISYRCLTRSSSLRRYWYTCHVLCYSSNRSWISLVSLCSIKTFCILKRRRIIVSFHMRWKLTRRIIRSRISWECWIIGCSWLISRIWHRRCLWHIRIRRTCCLSIVLVMKLSKRMGCVCRRVVCEGIDRKILLDWLMMFNYFIDLLIVV